MSQTVKAFARDVMLELGEDPYDYTLYQQAVRYVLDGVGVILSRHEWEWRHATESIATVASTQSYTLDSTALIPVAVVDADDADSPLTPVKKQDLIDAGVDFDEESAEPSAWYLDGLGSSSELKISLWPVPSAVVNLTVHFLATDEGMTEDSTIPLPHEFLRALKRWVKAEFYGDMEDETAKGDRQRSMFERMMIDFADRYVRRPGVSRDIEWSDLPRSNYTRFRVPKTVTP